MPCPQTAPLTLEGHEIHLEPGAVQVGTEQATGWFCADDRGIQLALSTELSAALLREGMARDFIRQVQQLRKDGNLEIENRICVDYLSDNPQLAEMLSEWGDLIRSETLANRIVPAEQSPPDLQPVSVGNTKVWIWIETICTQPRADCSSLPGCRTDDPLSNAVTHFCS